MMATSECTDSAIKQSQKENEALRRRIAEIEGKEKHADELLTILQMGSPVGLFVSQDRKFVFVNHEFLKMMGYTDRELLGTHSLYHVHPRDRKMVRENAIRMLKGESVTPYQYRLIGKDGQLRWVLEGVVSVQYKGKRAALGHTMDITDRIESEAKLRKLLNNEKRLRHELEEEVNKRVEYTRMLVHELKTPLTPVLFSSELLASELHDEILASVAHNIHRGAVNLDHRINELLDIARGEIGLLRIRPKMIDARPLLQNVAAGIQALMDRNHQAFVCAIPDSPLPVWADEERLQQIVLNLLINASKYSLDGSKITLSCKQEKENLVVHVVDNGPGIRKKDQNRIFKPYQRYDSGTPEYMSGLGLGLSLCKNLVELHGGKIWLESKKGEGTVFTFTIPVKKPAAVKSRKTRKASI